jgi:hypothetical protein
VAIVTADEADADVVAARRAHADAGLDLLEVDVADGDAALERAWALLGERGVLGG